MRQNEIAPGLSATRRLSTNGLLGRCHHLTPKHLEFVLMESSPELRSPRSSVVTALTVEPSEAPVHSQRRVEDSNVGNLRHTVPKRAQFMSSPAGPHLPRKQASMISILGIGVVTALIVFALVLKTRASEPKKAQKAEKAAIMKQLLALSERENGISAVAPSRTATPRSDPRKRPVKLPPKPARRPPPQVHSSQGRC